jgi:hypothetical protein
VQSLLESTIADPIVAPIFLAIRLEEKPYPDPSAEICLRPAMPL